MAEGKFEVLKGPAGDGEAHSQPGAGIEVYSPPCYLLLPGNLLPPVNLATCTSTQRQEQPISTWQPKTLPSVVATCCVVSDRSLDLCEEVVILYVFWLGSSFAKNVLFLLLLLILLLKSSLLSVIINNSTKYFVNIRMCLIRWLMSNYPVPVHIFFCH